MSKLELNFMVDPNELANKAYVKDGIRIKIIDIDKMREQNILGESGLRLAQRGFVFIFTKESAKFLIEKKIACLSSE
jgi:hypothetical protein